MQLSLAFVLNVISFIFILSTIINNIIIISVIVMIIILAFSNKQIHEMDEVHKEET